MKPDKRMEFAALDAAEYLERIAAYHGIGDLERCPSEGDCDEHDRHCDRLGDLCGHRICDENGCILLRAKHLRTALAAVAP